MTLHFKGLPSAHSARITIVDKEHGSPLPVYDKLGRPQSPTPSQIEELRKAAALPAPQQQKITKGAITLKLQPHALALVELER